MSSPCIWATMTARRNLRRTMRGQPVRIPGRTAWALPLFLLDFANRGGSAAPSTHRVDPSTPPPGQGTVSQSATASECRVVAMRAGCAVTVGSVSGRGKRQAMPTIAICGAISDHVGDALEASPTRPLSSTPPTSSCRRSLPSVLRDATRCQRACIPVRGITRRWASVQAVVPTTRGRTRRVRRRPARASPLHLLNGADSGGSAAPGTHR